MLSARLRTLSLTRSILAIGGSSSSELSSKSITTLTLIRRTATKETITVLGVAVATSALPLEISTDSVVVVETEVVAAEAVEEVASPAATTSMTAVGTKVAQVVVSVAVTPCASLTSSTRTTSTRLSRCAVCLSRSASARLETSSRTSVWPSVTSRLT